jgi:acyl carrier protein
MTREEWKGRVVELICEIAPEIEPSSLSEATDLHVDLDLDSMDLLNLVEAIHERLGVTIPDADASSLRTLGEVVGYLDEHAP